MFILLRALGGITSVGESSNSIRMRALISSAGNPWITGMGKATALDDEELDDGDDDELPPLPKPDEPLNVELEELLDDEPMVTLGAELEDMDPPTFLALRHISQGLFVGTFK
jgi:hypothetical protein